MYIELNTDRLRLRPLSSGDTAAVHEYAADDENTRYMYFLPNSTRDGTARFLARVDDEWAKDAPEFYEFAVTLDGRVIGAVSLARYGDEGELGWIINKRYWGMGYASEAAEALLSFARTVGGLTRLRAHCDQRNEPSYRIMEKLGLTLKDATGTRTYRDGETAGEYLYTLELE